MKKTSHAVIFDWNGTLIADTTLCVRGTNQVLAFFDLPPVTTEAYQEAYTVPLLEMYQQFGCNRKEIIERQQEFFSVFVRHYREKEDRLRLRKGARGALQALKTKNHHVAVLSNYTVSGITKQTDRLKITPLFDAVLANAPHENPIAKKGKGDRLKTFVEERGIQSALIVGDTMEEIEIAHDYGFLAVAVSGGTCTAARLKKAKPEFLISHLEELPEIAKKVFERSGQ